MGKMHIKTATGAAAATTTLTLTAPAVKSATGSTTVAKTRILKLHDIVVTAHDADIATDVVVTITNASSETYVVKMRAGKVFGFTQGFQTPIESDGNMTITATTGGAGVKTTISANYEVI